MTAISNRVKKDNMNNTEKDKLFEGINAQIAAYGYAVVICCPEQDVDAPSVDNPFHLIYPQSSHSALKVRITNAGFHVSDARHERRGYYFGLRVKMC